jgi:hypothetical protein
MEELQVKIYKDDVPTKRQNRSKSTIHHDDN